MFRVLLSSRMLAFHALVLLIVPSFTWLGFWQLGRWEDKSAAADLQTANISADPVPLEELSAVGSDVGRADRWRPVTLTGRYDTEHELLVRNRDGSRGVGLYVLTPLVGADGTAALVNRGWVPQPATATSEPDVPAAPDGEVTVTGRIQFSETPENTGIRERGGLPEGQIMIIEVDRIAEGLPYPVYGGFVELTDQEPASDPAPEEVAPPETNMGMNLSYAVQWWVFTVIGVCGWVFLMRREVADARSGAAPADGGGPGEGAPPPGGPADGPADGGGSAPDSSGPRPEARV
ncbi:SURF1 family protein [Nocardiopsis sediminis]|uniref:SURF1-like protein n=1 Tax=Nocardiopsis sediminis TaxID=1778267 RepID=A0ABV8FSL1_9ACTN